MKISEINFNLKTKYLIYLIFTVSIGIMTVIYFLVTGNTQSLTSDLIIATVLILFLLYSILFVNKTKLLPTINISIIGVLSFASFFVTNYLSGKLYSSFVPTFMVILFVTIFLDYKSLLINFIIYDICYIYTLFSFEKNYAGYTILEIAKLLLYFNISMAIIFYIMKNLKHNIEISESKAAETKEHLASTQKQIEKIKQLSEKQNYIFSSIKVVAKSVNEASEIMTSTTEKLSEGATYQASTLEELASTITEVSEKIGQNAESSNEAEKLAISTAETVKSGKEIICRMVSSMNDIYEASREIQNILKDINDIAFQTNILSLNAAVEAARAGSAGKGFSVVAQEVRNLSVKCTEAADNTTSLIENTLKAVDKGQKLADETQNSIEQISKIALDTTRVVKKINVASNQQAISVSEISKGISSISEIVNNFTATAEETASSSEELSEQANKLSELIKA